MKRSIAVGLFTVLAASCGPDIQKDPGVVYVNNQNNAGTNGGTGGGGGGTNSGSMNSVSVNNTATNNVSMNNASMNNASINNVSVTNSMNNTSSNNAMSGEACLNMNDLEILGDTANREPIDSCGLSCLGEADTSGCASDCIQVETGMTAPCADCLGDATECTITNCLMQCVNGSDNMDCVACQETFCVDDFTACSGVELP